MGTGLGEGIEIGKLCVRRVLFYAITKLDLLNLNEDYSLTSLKTLGYKFAKY